jgi:TonB family protein
MRSNSAHTHLQWPIAAAVVIAHVIALAWLMTWTTQGVRERDAAQKNPTIIAGFIIDDERTRDRLPIAEVALETPRIALQSITQVQFESAEWGDISGVTASSSAPQLSRFQPITPALFARRAGLASGQAASVVLTVEILPDGTVGTVEVTRSFGDPAIDAAAVAYARRLRWVPGTQNHHAQAMRINLPVTLVWNA